MQKKRKARRGAKKIILAGAIGLLAALALLGQLAKRELPVSPQQTQPEIQVRQIEPVLVLNATTGQVEQVPMRQYVLGAVASEMPISYQPAALQAQAVAAYSYALACKNLQAENPTAALKGAWLSADPANRQGYLTEGGMRAVWGDAFEENYQYLCQAVDQVLGQVLLYDQKPALTTYYAISNGSGEASENVWVSPVPYLVQLELPLDRQAPQYEVTVDLTAQEVSDALKLSFLALDLSDSPENWFGQERRSPAGYVTAVPCGGQLLDGQDLRSALKLRSADFTITWQQDHFEVTCRGYGHGVGMSQYTANQLALQGKTYQEILAFFYPGTTLGAA